MDVQDDKPQATRSQDRIKAIVFDFDGTLVDTMQSFADTAADVMSTRHGVELSWARQQYLETSGIPFFQQLEVLFPGDEKNEAAAQEFEERKLDAFFNESFEHDVVNAIQALRAQGYSVAISSNNFQHLIDQFVQRESLTFDVVLGCRENFFKGTDHFHHLEEALQLRSDDLLFVGDSLMDGVRARENGVRFVGKTGTFGAEAFEQAHPGTPTVSRLSELSALIPTLV
jgi:phosphoglycolate phosphatase-like HAD superfamily hydrolase